MPRVSLYGVQAHLGKSKNCTSLEVRKKINATKKINNCKKTNTNSAAFLLTQVQIITTTNSINPDFFPRIEAAKDLSNKNLGNPCIPDQNL